MASKEFASVPEFVKSVHYMLGGPGTLDASASWVDEDGESIDYAKKGTVLGKVTATGLLVPYDDGGSDGEETAVGILWEDVSFGEDGDEDTSGVYMIHGRVDENKLIGIDANGKTDLAHIIFEDDDVGAVTLWSTLSGSLVDATYGVAVAGAVITLTLPDGTSTTATSDATGVFEFTDIPHGTLSYSIAHDNYVTKTGTIAVGYNEDTEFDDDIELTPSTGTVSGTITDGEGNVSGAVVTIIATDGETELTDTTGVDGTYSIESVPYGTLAYTIVADGYTTVSDEIEVDGDETLSAELVAAG